LASRKNIKSRKNKEEFPPTSTLPKGRNTIKKVYAIREEWSSWPKYAQISIIIGLIMLSSLIVKTCSYYFSKSAHRKADQAVAKRQAELNDKQQKEIIQTLNEIRLDGDELRLQNYKLQIEREFDITYDEVSKSVANYKMQKANEETPWLAEMMFFWKEYEQAIPAYLNCAYHGNPHCQNRIGRMYRKGLGTPVDIKKSIIFHSQAAEQGNHNSQNELGIIFGTGLVGRVDNALSLDYYEQAATSNKPIYLTNLAYMYQNGLGTEVDVKKAHDLLQNAADQGYYKAQLNLGILYYEHEQFSSEAYKAETYFKSASEQGSVEAAYALGMYYISVGKKKQAIAPLEQAATDNHPLALYNLGILHVSGSSQELDIQKGVNYLKQAANLDEENAKYYLDRYFPDVKY